MISSLPPRPRTGRILLSGGAIAYLRFRTPAGCVGGANVTPPVYQRLTITIGKHTISLSGLSIPGRCGLYESPVCT